MVRTTSVSYFAVAFFLSFLGRSAPGATVEKANNATNLNVGSSWVGGNMPGSFDSAVWDSTVTGSNTASVGGALALGQVVVLDPGGPVMINSFGTLALNGAGGTAIDLSAATQDLAINCPVTLASGQTWNVGAGRTLTVGGAIGGGFGLTIAGSGTTALSNAYNTYTGGTTLLGGTLKANSFGHSGSSIAIMPGATLDLSGGTFSSTSATYSVSVAGAGIGGNGAMVNSSGTGVIASIRLAADTTLGGSNAWSFREPTPGTAVLGNGNNLTKAGSNLITFNGSPEELYVTGVANINVTAGTLSVLARTTIDNSQPGSIYVNAGATLAADATGQSPIIQKPIVLAGGLLESGMSGQNYKTVIGAGISLNATGTIAPQANSVLTLAGAISDGTASNGLVLIGGTGSSLVLAGSNTYSGNTTISSGMLAMGVDNSLPSGAGKGNVMIASGATLDVHGYKLSINGISGTGNVDNNGASGKITVGNNNASSIFFGLFQNSYGTLSLVKSGTGSLVLGGNSTYVGGTTISAGTLQIGNGGSTGSVPGNVTDNGALAFSRSDSPTFAGSISGTGAVIQSGPGTLILTGSDNYSGATLINGGSLVVGTAASLSPCSDVTVNGGLLDASAFAFSVKSLTLGGGTLNLGMANTLSASNAVALGGTIGIAGTAANSTGRYTLISAGSAISGSLAGAIVANPNPNFSLKVDATGHNLVYQHLATLDAPTLSAVNPTVVTGGTTALLAGFRNSAPLQSDNLSFQQTYADAAVSGYDASRQSLSAGGTSGGYTNYPATYQSGSPGTQTVTVTATPMGSVNDAPQVASTIVNVLDHAAPSLTVGSGDHQSVIVGAGVATANLILTNGTPGQAGLAALDVNSLGSGVSGPTGGAIVTSGSAQSYMAIVNPTTFGPQNVVFSVTVGDDHTLSGASVATIVSATASLTIWDHANASLSATVNQTTQTIDFGNLLKGAAPPNQNFTLYNLAANTSTAYTTNLKLTGFTTSGDAALTTNLSTFGGMAASSGNTYSASLDTSNYTSSGITTVCMAASQLADDSTLAGAGSNNNAAVTLVLHGNVGNAIADASNSRATFGPALTAAVANYAGLESTVKSTTGSGGQGMIGSTATVLAGTASAPATVSMAWRTAVSPATGSGGDGLVSDVVNLSGVAVVDQQTSNGSAHTDTFVLRMNYDPMAVMVHTGMDELSAALAGEITMEYLDAGLDGMVGTADDVWELAVNGNTGSSNRRFVGLGPFSGDLKLGDYGVDIQSHTVWAVLDHEGQFAVVPEPSTLVLLAAGAIGLMGWVWRRRFVNVRGRLAAL